MEGRENVTVITAVLWLGIVKEKGEIIAVAYCVLSSGGNVSGKVVFATKVYAVAAPCYIR
jgi:hypothetical protein